MFHLIALSVTMRHKNLLPTWMISLMYHLDRAFILANGSSNQTSYLLYSFERGVLAPGCICIWYAYRNLKNMKILQKILKKLDTNICK